jgi:selenocysteine lyase/cysteine desulfurase
MGEFPQFVLTAMATAALRQVLAWSVEHIQASLSTLTLQVERGALGIGAQPVAAQDRVGHMIGVRPHSGVNSAFVESLAAANVYVSVRGDAIRVAPHVYNTSADIDRLLDVLHESGS